MNEAKVLAAMKAAVLAEGYYIVRQEVVADGGRGFAFHFRTAPKPEGARS